MNRIDVENKLKEALDILKECVDVTATMSEVSSIEHMDIQKRKADLESIWYHFWMSNQDLRSKRYVEKCCGKCHQS